ncbi:MAG: ion channel [Caldilineaceae bacterium]
MIFLVANVTWFVDRKMNEDFPRPYWRGIWEAIWWSTVTVTTVGYGDKTPKSPAGRFVGILWMLLGLFLVANFTAGMTAALSVRALQSQISGLGDLDDMRVATVAGTSADTFMADNRLSPALRTPTIEEAFDALLANDVDAVLFDGPILLSFANTDGAGRVKVLAYRFDTEFYASRFPRQPAPPASTRRCYP